MSDGIDNSHNDICILLRVGIWPVLGAFDLHLLHEVGQHDHIGDIVVPYQTPKISKSVWQGTLCGNVLLLPIVSLAHRVTQREKSIDPSY